MATEFIYARCNIVCPDGFSFLRIVSELMRARGVVSVHTNEDELFVSVVWRMVQL